MTRHDCPQNKPEPPLRCPVCRKPMMPPCEKCGWQDFECRECGCCIPSWLYFAEEKTVGLIQTVRKACERILYYSEMEPTRKMRMKAIQELLEAVGAENVDMEAYSL